MALIASYQKGSTDRSVELRIIDSGDGTPETGVVFNTSGIDLWYRRQGAAKVSITEATLSALTDAHSDGGFLHIGSGVYRLDLPDAAFASGADYVAIGGDVTGMVVIGGRVGLTDHDPQDIPADMLKRDWTGMTGEAARSMLNALRFIRNKWSIAAGTLTVCKENDSTTAWTAAVSTDAAADPITGNDPA